MCESLGVEASEGMLHKVTKIFNVMRQRVAAGAGPAVQRSHRSYRVPLMQKACTALQALPDQQGTLPDILQYIAGRVDWHDDLTWGISHTNTSRGPAWHTEIQKAVTRSPAIVHTGEKRGRAFVYRYDPTLDRARAPRKASRWGLAGVPLNAGPAHAPAR